MKHLLKLTITALISFPAWSDTGPLTEVHHLSIYSSCVEEMGGPTNGSVAACANKTANIASTDINSTLNRIQNKLEQNFPEENKVLINSQRNWITYRNEHCHLMSMFAGGAMEGYCPMQLNLQRLEEVIELEHNLSQE